MTDETHDHIPSGDAPDSQVDVPQDALGEALNAALDGDEYERADDPEIVMLLATMDRLRATPPTGDEILSVGTMDGLWTAIVQEVTPRLAARSLAASAIAYQSASKPSHIGGRWSSRWDGAGTALLRSTPARTHARERRSAWRSVGSWCSMALIAAMLIAMGSMVWALRPGADDDHSLLASATSLAVGTALASPSPVATDGESWLRWPLPEDCNVEPMSHEDYATIMSAQPDISGRSYEVVGPPSEAEAIAAADAARIHFACEAFSLTTQERTLSSAAYTFFQSWSMARTTSDADLATANLVHGMELSVTLEPKRPSAYIGYPEGTPDIAEMALWPLTEWSTQLPYDVQVALALTFDPANAMELADGRIAIPATMLGFMLDGHSVTQDDLARRGTDLPALDVVAPPLYVMTQESGRWVVDEVLTYCPYAGCGPVWQAWAEEGMVPVPSMDGPVPWTISTGTATPAASPAPDRTATPKP